MDIRKTRILHKRYTLAEWVGQTLRQGELGFLLSDDKRSVLEIRVGTRDIYQDGRIIGVSWDEAISLASVDGGNGEQFATIYELNQVIQQLSLTQAQVTQNTENIASYEDTDTRCDIEPGEETGTLKITFVSKDGYRTPGYIVEIPGWKELVDVANGRSSAHVYDSSISVQFTDSLRVPNKYKLGDIIYFKDDTSHDVWVADVYPEMVENSYYQLLPLYAETPELDNYLTKEEASRVYVTNAVLESLTTEQFGQAGTYVESIQQKSGRVAVVTKTLPDYTPAINEAAGNVLVQALEYTDTRIGNTGLTTDGARKTVVQFINDVTSNVTTEVTNVKTSVEQISTRVTNLESTTNQRVTQVESDVFALNALHQNHESRIQILEQNLTSKPTAGTITQLKVNGNPLTIEDGVVNIDKISTDMLVQGENALVLDCNNMTEKK